MTDTPSPENSSTKLAESKRLRYFELCLVLLVALLTPLTSSLYVLINGPGHMANSSPYRWVTGTLHEILALMLLGYVLTRRGRRFRDLGLQWSIRDCVVGLFVLVVSYVAYIGGGALLQTIHYAAVGEPATRNSARTFFAHPGFLAVPFVLVTPFFEELIVRAYLMTEVLELSGSSALAIVVSVLVQTSYHLYYGWFGAASLGFMFLVFSLYYAHYRRALPVIVAHGVYDLIAMIRLW